MAFRLCGGCSSHFWRLGGKGSLWRITASFLAGFGQMDSARSFFGATEPSEPPVGLVSGHSLGDILKLTRKTYQGFHVETYFDLLTIVYASKWVNITNELLGISTIPTDPPKTELSIPQLSTSSNDVHASWAYGTPGNSGSKPTKSSCAGWWLNQPIWKICSSNWIISPGMTKKMFELPPPRSTEPYLHEVKIHVSPLSVMCQNPRFLGGSWRPPVWNQPLWAFHRIHPCHCHVSHFCHAFLDAFDTFDTPFFKLPLLLQQLKLTKVEHKHFADWFYRFMLKCLYKYRL